MAYKFKEVDSILKDLELKEYPLSHFVKLIVGIPSLQKEDGLFDQCPYYNPDAKWRDDFYSEGEVLRHPETGEKISLEDVKVDMSYQRLLRLKKLIDHLRSIDHNDISLGYDKMCAGAIDIAIRPEGASFTWDGFRRSIIAMIFGIRYPKYSICVHPKNWSDEKCRAQEAFAFKKRNGDNEPMAREELYKSGLQFSDPKCLETLDVLKKCKLDVLRTNPNASKTLDGFAEFEDTIHKKKVDIEHLVTASTIIRKSWSKDTSVSSYLLCGLARYIHLENDMVLDFSHNITGKDGCDLLPKMKNYASENTQGSLVKNRISKYGIETISARIAFNILEVELLSQQTQVAEKLGFDEEGVRQVLAAYRNQVKGTILPK